MKLSAVLTGGQIARLPHTKRATRTPSHSLSTSGHLFVRSGNNEARLGSEVCGGPVMVQDTAPVRHVIGAACDSDGQYQA